MGEVPVQYFVFGHQAVQRNRDKNFIFTSVDATTQSMFVAFEEIVLFNQVELSSLKKKT